MCVCVFFCSDKTGRDRPEDEEERERGEGKEKGKGRRRGGFVEIVEADAAALCLAAGLIVS